MRFDEVVFLDDFFRSADNGLASHPNNRRFLRAFFQGSCQRLGIPLREVCAQSDGGDVAVGTIMDRLGLERSTHGWAAASTANLASALTDDLSLNLGRRSLVIGWGLPPSLLEHLDDQGAAFIDVEIDPLRFGRHLYLCARTNDAQIRRVLERLEVSKEVFWSSASALQGYFARTGSRELIGSSCSVGLFAGQTDTDLSLVSGGRLVAPTDHIAQIARWAEEVDVLLVKRHPYATGTGPLSEVVQQIPNAIWVDYNIYGMFTARNLRFVGALSSGALKEAEYFGVEGRALMTPDRADARRLPRACSRWFTVTADIAAIPAVESMLRVIRPWNRSRRSLIEPTFDAEVLERMFGLRWGLDTGVAGLPDCTLLSPGKVYRFAHDGNATGWLTAGWHAVETWGVWSASAICSLILPMVRTEFQGGGRLKLELSGPLFGNARIAGIEVDGEMLLPTCQARDGSAVVSVELDEDCFAGKAKAFVNLHIDGAARPIDVTGAADFRELGFGLTELRVSGVQDTDALDDATESYPETSGLAPAASYT